LSWIDQIMGTYDVQRAPDAHQAELDFFVGLSSRGDRNDERVSHD
jgi:hypothetical protein